MEANMKKITFYAVIALVTLTLSIMSFSDVLYSDTDHTIPVVADTQTAQSSELSLATFNF